METINTIKKNPLQAITVVIAIVGVVFSIFNFYLLANISPIEKRVVALEKFDEENKPLIVDFIGMRTDIKTIKEDIRDIKNFLKIR